jgi:hypothetical protein
MSAKVGVPVKILVRCGAVAKGTCGSATHFIETVEPGQQGLYVGKVPGPLGKKDWHVVSLGAYDVPLHSSQFEVLA